MEHPHIPAYISLGGNTGDLPATFAMALERIARIPHVRLGACSSLYMTEPQGMPAQPWFYNQVVHLGYAAPVSDTANIQARAGHFLEALLEIETHLGRTRSNEPRFGPRPIDIDLLSFGGIICDTPQMTLPHPRMHARAFILVPLLEIAPDLVVPGLGSVHMLLDRLRFSVEDGKIYQQ